MSFGFCQEVKVLLKFCSKSLKLVVFNYAAPGYFMLKWITIPTSEFGSEIRLVSKDFDPKTMGSQKRTMTCVKPWCGYIYGGYVSLLVMTHIKTS